MKQKVKRYIVPGIWVFILVLAFVLRIVFPTGDIDLSYNSYFAKAVNDGLMPYRDFGVTMTPLSFLISALALKVNNSMVTVSVVGTIFAYISGLFIYLVAKNLNDNKLLALIIAGASTLILTSSGAVNCNYNMMSAAFLFGTIAYVTSKADRDKWYYVLPLSLLSSTACWTKQNYGAFICLYVVLSLVVFKKDIKNTLKFVGSMLIINIPILAVIWKIGIWNEFYTMCFSGVSSFAFCMSVISAIYIAVAIAGSVFIFVKGNTTEKIYGLGLLISLLFLYPNANEGHLLYLIPLALVPIVFFKYIMKNDFSGKDLENMTFVPAIAFIVINVARLFVFERYNSIPEITQSDFMGNIMIEQEEAEQVSRFAEIRNKCKEPVYFLTETGTYVALVTDSYTKYFDLFFDGNLGGADAAELIENTSDCYFVAPSDEKDLFWQVPTDAYHSLSLLQVKEEITIGEKNPMNFLIYYKK